MQQFLALPSSPSSPQLTLRCSTQPSLSQSFPVPPGCCSLPCLTSPSSPSSLMGAAPEPYQSTPVLPVHPQLQFPVLPVPSQSQLPALTSLSQCSQFIPGTASSPPSAPRSFQVQLPVLPVHPRYSSQSSQFIPGTAPSSFQVHLPVLSVTAPSTPSSSPSAPSSHLRCRCRCGRGAGGGPDVSRG